MSHRGVEEVYTSQQQDRTVWQPRPADRELEAEMLSRILVKIGYDDKKVVAAAGLNPTARAAAAASPAAPERDATPCWRTTAPARWW